MTTSNPNVDPDLVNDPLLDLYHCVDGGLAPEEMATRRVRRMGTIVRKMRTFPIDISE